MVELLSKVHTRNEMEVGGGGGGRGSGWGSGRDMGTRSQSGGRTDQDLEVSELLVSDLLLKNPGDENPAAHQ